MSVGNRLAGPAAVTSTYHSAWMDRTRHLMLAHRRLAALLIYGYVTGMAYAAAFLLRFEFEVPQRYSDVLWATLPVLVATRMVFAGVFRLSSGRWRFIGPRDMVRLVLATLLGSVVFALVLQVPAFSGIVPRSLLVLEPMLTILCTAGLWVTYRAAFEHVNHHRARGGRAVKRVLIVGAGEAGFMLSQEMQRAAGGYRTVGFVDDNPYKWGTSLNGLEVIGGTMDLASIVRSERAEEVVIAIPSAAPPQLRIIVEACEGAGVPFRVLPGVAEVLKGRVQLSQLREVRIEDLLGREPIQLELPELEDDLRGETVLVTGAAGSIGSELCRQVATNRPDTLVLFDHAETALFYLELELREKHPDLHLVPVVGDIVDGGAVERVFREYAPSRVFHAAAYKHVPMMETNAREAVRNNAVGTWRVAEAAGRHRAEKFVLVSTDKAVRPANVMGASKRMAELVVLELQASFPATAFAAVRFGNVLGSNGSVLPVFRQQMQQGKPLTVTHPDVTRYFMTIPEAVQLILQASLLPELRGNIAMLEMGEPVKIVDLARNLLRLSGRGAQEDRNLLFTGLRPGEKMHEELSAPDERTVPTAIPKVRIIETPADRSWGVLDRVADWSWAFSMGEDSAPVAEFAGYFPDVRYEPAAPRAGVRAIRLAPVQYADRPAVPVAPTTRVGTN